MRNVLLICLHFPLAGSIICGVDAMVRQQSPQALILLLQRLHCSCHTANAQL
jgi:hypothetical protein